MPMVLVKEKKRDSAGVHGLQVPDWSRCISNALSGGSGGSTGWDQAHQYTGFDPKILASACGPACNNSMSYNAV